MAKTFLIHGGRCKGGIILDITRGFVISSPSISVSTRGLSIGVTEISTRKNYAGDVDYFCSKCCHVVDVSDISCKCLVCTKDKAVAEMYISSRILFACESCKSAIEGNDNNLSEEMKKIISYLRAGRETLDFVPMTQVLSKPIK